MSKNTSHPAQQQDKQPGIESQMNPQPIYMNSKYHGSNKLLNKIALVTGGDSGIGRAVSCLFAKEGADVIVHYLNEENDAKQTQMEIEKLGRTCWIMAADLTEYAACEQLIHNIINTCGSLDILVNNVAQQYPQDYFAAISCEQMEYTFKTDFFSYFYTIKAALPYLKPGSVIINTASVTAYKGSSHLIDYSATKGAIVSMTRSLSQNLVTQNIRVNAVAPGPIWTPLIPSSFSAEEVAEFGKNVPMKRAGQPVEIAPSYVFLASDDSSYMTGQVLHPNGGVIVNS